MIRFVDLTGQILLDDDEPQFAFFNTIPDMFVEVDGVQNWHSWTEFQSDVMNAKQTRGFDVSPENRVAVLDRFKAVVPLRFLRDMAPEPEKPSLSDLSEKLLARTQQLHAGICEFEGMVPPPYSEAISAWIDAVAAMDAAFELTPFVTPSELADLFCVAHIEVRMELGVWNEIVLESEPIPGAVKRMGEEVPVRPKLVRRDELEAEIARVRDNTGQNPFAFKFVPGLGGENGL